MIAARFRFLLTSMLCVFAIHSAAQNQDSIRTDSIVDRPVMGTCRSKSELRQMRRDSIRQRKNLWISVLGGPSYTPEASFGIGGAMLTSFRINRADSVSQRSYLPVGFNLSLNGTIVVSGTGALFMRQNRFRIYL